MKNLLSIILTTVIIMSAMAIPAFADQPYYPCYEGTWNIKENSGTPIKLKIRNNTCSIHYITPTCGSFTSIKRKNPLPSILPRFHHTYPV